MSTITRTLGNIRRIGLKVAVPPLSQPGNC